MAGLSFGGDVAVLASRVARRAGPLARRAVVASQQWVTPVEVALALALGALAAQLAWTILAPPGWPDATAVPVRRALPLQAVPGGGLLDQENLFHRARAGVRDGDRAGDAIGQAPETMLNLSLFGIRAGVDGKAGGTAIIGTPDNKQDAYAIGQEIMPGIRLERILPDRVVIRRNGVLESLSFDRERGGRPAPDAEAAGAGVPAAAEGAAAPRVRIATSLAEVLAGVQVQPRGTQGGLVLRPRGSSDLLRQAGLAPGDVLLAINGRAVTGVAALPALAEELKQVKNLSIDIERGGQKQTVRLVIDD